MDRTHANKQLAKLFESADLRMPELIRALDDAEQKVRLNSQYIINQLAEDDGLKALDDWRKRQTGTYSSPVLKFVAQQIYLEGDSRDLQKLVRKNIGLFQIARYDDKDISIKLIAYNKRTKTALFELFQGQVFTEGWHSVIKFKGDKWRLVTDTNVWQS